MVTPPRRNEFNWNETLSGSFCNENYIDERQPDAKLVRSLYKIQNYGFTLPHTPPTPLSEPADVLQKGYTIGERGIERKQRLVCSFSNCYVVFTSAPFSFRAYTVARIKWFTEQTFPRHYCYTKYKDLKFPFGVKNKTTLSLPPELKQRCSDELCTSSIFDQWNIVFKNVFKLKYTTTCYTRTYVFLASLFYSCQMAKLWDPQNSLTDDRWVEYIFINDFNEFKAIPKHKGQ